MPHVGMFAAKTNLSALVEQALAGEEVVLTRHGTPVVRIVPYTTPRSERAFGAYAHLTPPDADWSAVTEPMSEDELRLWEGGQDAPTGRGPEPA